MYNESLYEEIEVEEYITYTQEELLWIDEVNEIEKELLELC